MRSFVLHAPSTLDEALDLREQHGADSMLLAGGQSLLILLRQGLVAPEPLISIEAIDELDRVVGDPDEFRIGAMTTYATIAAHPELQAVVPLLSTAAGRVGSVHIRNRGTIGGSLAHADPAGDVPVALLALDADVVLASRSGGERQVPVKEFFAGGLFETVVADTEILTRVRVPRPTSQASYGYRRFSYREGEYPQCQAAVRLVWRDGLCRSARVAVGGAGPNPRRLSSLEEELVGTALHGDEIEHRVDVVLPELEPIADVRGSVDWKRQVVRHVLIAALQDAKAAADG